MLIKVKEVPIKAYNSIRKVEWYYTLLRRVYKIISSELKDASKELILQTAVKAVNNSAGPDRLVPTLLVFSSYPRITNNSLLSPSII
jgi:hypothetical protein